MIERDKEKNDTILKSILFFHFKNNVVFKFSDFVNRVKETDIKQVYFTYDILKIFIYELIDTKMISQIYVDENENPFLDESISDSTSISTVKSIHFKLIVPGNEN